MKKKVRLGLLLAMALFLLTIPSMVMAGSEISVNDETEYEQGIKVNGVDVYSETQVCKIGDTKYSSLGAAISAASANDTITMLKDYECVGTERYLFIPPNVTLDLYGKKVTANTVASFGKIIDEQYKEANPGKLIVNAGTNLVLNNDVYDTAQPTANFSYLPYRTQSADGKDTYQFAKINRIDHSHGIREGNHLTDDNPQSTLFQYKVANSVWSKIYGSYSDSNDAGILYTFDYQYKYKNMKADDRTLSFRFSLADSKEYARLMANSGTPNWYLYVKLVGAKEFDWVKATPVIKSTYGSYSLTGPSVTDTAPQN